MHKLILKGDENFSNDDSMNINMLYRTTKFDLIVCGDNHQSFSMQKNKRFIYNIGALTRSRIDQAAHKPCVYIFDTEKRTSKKVLLTIKPFEEVMNLEKATASKEKNERLESFIVKLADNVAIDGLNFANNITEHIKKNKVTKQVRTFIEGVMQ